MIITLELGGLIVIKLANDVGITQRLILTFENAIHFVKDGSLFLQKTELDDPSNWNINQDGEDHREMLRAFEAFMPNISDNDLGSFDRHEFKNKFNFGMDDTIIPASTLITTQTADMDDRVQVFLCSPGIYSMLIEQLRVRLDRISRSRN